MERITMASIADIILATTEQEREAAHQAIAKRNAEAPSDWQVVAAFLKQCTTLDGKPLALDERGRIVERND
jgi:hypothetical protein